MPATLTVTVRCRMAWPRWLLWPFVRLWLLAMVRLGRLSGQRAYDIGSRWLVGSYWMQVDNRPWERLEVP